MSGDPQDHGILGMVFLGSLLLGLGVGLCGAIATFDHYRSKTYPIYQCLITSLLTFVIIGSTVQAVGYMVLILFVKAR
jgi:hypothetical protein